MSSFRAVLLVLLALAATSRASVPPWGVALEALSLISLSLADAGEDCEYDLASFVQTKIVPSRQASSASGKITGAELMPTLLERSEHVDLLEDNGTVGNLLDNLGGEGLGNTSSHGAWQARTWWRHHKPWQASRYSRPTWNEHLHNIGFHKFFLSAFVGEWLVFVGIMLWFVLIQYSMYEWPTKYYWHGAGLLVWFVLAVACNLMVWWRFGRDDATLWFSGYMLELVFSIENVFVFHIVMRAFRVPRKHAQKALVAVVIAQILFEMSFFMGLAWAIRSSNVLPYVLGAWLVYVGYLAGTENKLGDIEFKETWVYYACTSLFGNRLRTKYPRNDVTLIGSDEGGFYISLLFLATVSLVVVDFVLEVDVVLTKIEELENHFLAFTSSAVAAFAVPELFFVSRDLFARYYLLKFGISLVLVFFGLQLLFHQLVSIAAFGQVLITIVIMLICVVLSVMLPAGMSDLDADREKYEAENAEGE